MARKPIVQLLSTNGDGTGDTAVIGDYASAAETFEIQPPAGSRYYISRLLIYIVDTGTFDTATYGNAITLTNGWSLQILSKTGTVISTLTPAPVKVTGDIASLCYDITNHTFGTGPEIMAARWTFAKFTEGGEGVVLDQEERLVLNVNDDYSGLDDQRFTVQGWVSGDFY